jgi:hypothetical protein
MCDSLEEQIGAVWGDLIRTVLLETLRSHINIQADLVAASKSLQYLIPRESMPLELGKLFDLFLTSLILGEGFVSSSLSIGDVDGQSPIISMACNHTSQPISTYLNSPINRLAVSTSTGPLVSDTEVLRLSCSSRPRVIGALTGSWMVMDLGTLNVDDRGKVDTEGEWPGKPIAFSGSSGSVPLRRGVRSGLGTLILNEREDYYDS